MWRQQLELSAMKWYVTSFVCVIPSPTNPSLRDWDISSLARLKPTRFAADATQLVRRGLIDGTGKNVVMWSDSFSALRAACLDEEIVGDIKCGDPALNAALLLLPDGPEPFLFLLRVVFIAAHLGSFGVTLINRV